MKPLLKLILVVIAVLSAVNLLTMDQAARDHISAGSASAGAATSSEALFKQKCAKCHGADGSGDTSMGRIFGPPDFTDSAWWAKNSSKAEHIRVITNGKKNMPAFGKKLTKAQIAGLATYVQQFKP